jgi:hypothetical protein
MDTGIVYKKTRKGEDEIRERRGKLSQKMRTMLILIDGTKSTAQLAVTARQLGIADDYLALLTGQELIAPVNASPGQAAAAPQDEVQRFSEAKRFMNETVVNALGMRSFFFTLKLEKCGTRGDLRELMEEYGKAVAKGTDADEAAVLVARAQELLA